MTKWATTSAKLAKQRTCAQRPRTTSTVDNGVKSSAALQQSLLPASASMCNRVSESEMVPLLLVLSEVNSNRARHQLQTSSYTKSEPPKF